MQKRDKFVPKLLSGGGFGRVDPQRGSGVVVNPVASGVSSALRAAHAGRFEKNDLLDVLVPHRVHRLNEPRRPVVMPPSGLRSVF
jgi:hypothetical protein